jgi:hypothetical protein
MKLQRILAAAIVAVFSLGVFGYSTANAAGTYAISCKNNAYGMHLGSDYTQVAYVYNAAAIQQSAVANGAAEYLITEFDQAYVGNDCLYAGSADTNGTAVVAGDVARLAVSAIVGAVTNRIDMAYAAKESGASATGLSFTTQSDGISMSANKIVGGLSFWGDFGNSDFKNDQKYTSARLDSMKFDGSASSYSVGIDKLFGKALVGLVVSNIDTDLKTTFNDGTYKQEIDTYGVYLAYKTRIFQLDLGMGEGESDITTTRRDLGNDTVINGKTTADVTYQNARLTATFKRGRFSLVPHASYRQMSVDMKAFTDDRADEVQATVAGNGLLFTAGNEGQGGADGLTVTDDSISARSVESETLSFGARLSANIGNFVPYVEYAYEAEDTSKAAYKTEAGTDGNDSELAVSDYDSSNVMGAGVNFMLGSHIKGGIRMGSVSSRNDWSESFVAGGISIGF